MIELSFPIKKSPVLVLGAPPETKKTGPFTPFEYHQSYIKKIDVAEWRRRNNIIVREAQSFAGKVGDTVYPIDKADYEKHGAFIILGICHSYKDMDLDEWPTNDVPMILHISTIREPKQIFNATVSWVTRKNPHV